MPGTVDCIPEAGVTSGPAPVFTFRNFMTLFVGWIEKLNFLLILGATLRAPDFFLDDHRVSRHS